MEDNLIRVLSNLPRSGGTLIGRCLGCMDGIVLLSEIHPDGAKIDQRYHPLLQAHQWHGLLEADDIRGRRLDFVDSIALVHRKCSDRGLHLVLRDWAYLDFMGVPYNETPSYRSRLIAALSGRFRPVQHSITRHPVAQWVSIAKGRVLKHHLSVAHFLKGYLKYAQDAVAGGFTRYEDFTRSPLEAMELLCRHLELPFDRGFLGKWAEYDRITGDRFAGSQSFGGKEIVPAGPAPVDPRLAGRFRDEEDYWQVLALLGYSDIPDHPE